MRDESASFLKQEVFSLIKAFDDRAVTASPKLTLYLVGAGSLLLEGIGSRATGDLDFICDEGSALFENIISETGFHSYSVSPGLVSMPRGWRKRCREASDVEVQNVKILIPDIQDRLIDKMARGLETDWQDIEAILRNASSRMEPKHLGTLAQSVFDDPPSSVFDPGQFQRNYERLQMLSEAHGFLLPPLNM